MGSAASGLGTTTTHRSFAVPELTSNCLASISSAATTSRSRALWREAAGRGRKDVEVSICLSGQLLGPARREMAVGVTSIGQLTHPYFRRHRPRDRRDRLPRDIKALNSSTAMSSIIRADRKRWLPHWPALESSWSRPIPGANFIFPDILEVELARISRVADAAAALSAEHLVIGGGARRLEGVAKRRLRASSGRPGESLRARERPRPQGALPSASVDDRSWPRPRSTGSSR